MAPRVVLSFRVGFVHEFLPPLLGVLHLLNEQDTEHGEKQAGQQLHKDCLDPQVEVLQELVAGRVLAHVNVPEGRVVHLHLVERVGHGVGDAHQRDDHTHDEDRELGAVDAAQLGATSRVPDKHVAEHSQGDGEPDRDAMDDHREDSEEHDEPGVAERAG